jgi:hypothetical protein
MPTLKACDICKCRMVDEGCVLVFVDIGDKWRAPAGKWFLCHSCTDSIEEEIRTRVRHHRRKARELP